MLPLSPPNGYNANLCQKGNLFSVSVLIVISLLCHESSAIQCFQCSGDYASSVCGRNFQLNVTDETTSLCNGTCLTETDFTSITRNCTEGQIFQTGCFNDISNVLRCVETCNHDFCNVASIQSDITTVAVSDVITCYSCNGSYSDSPCGYWFAANDPLVSQVSCNGSCVAVTTDFMTVSRQCEQILARPPGCRYDNQGRFVCRYDCLSDRCNGADILPDYTVQCYSCTGSYSDSPCGYRFNAGSPLVSLVKCPGKCVAITTDLMNVSRQCELDLTQPAGCQNDTEGRSVCRYDCRTDRCNGADILPPTTTSSPRTTNAQMNATLPPTTTNSPLTTNAQTIDAATVTTSSAKLTALITCVCLAVRLTLVGL